MIDRPTIRAVNLEIADGNLTIEDGIIRPVDMAREPPHPDTLDVLCLRFVREHGPMTLAWLYRHLDLAADANHTEIGESLSRLEREGLLTVQGDEVKAIPAREGGDTT
jgi:hypothetical protein